MTSPKPRTYFRLRGSDIPLAIHMLLVLLTFFLASFIPGRFANCLLDNHPAKLLLLFALVLGIVWATERMVVAHDMSRRRRVTWIILNLVVWLVMGFLLVNDYKSEKWLVVRGHDEIVVWFLAVLVGVLVVITASQKANSKEGGAAEEEAEISPGEIKRWGQAVALAIMLLAMFFLAVEYKQESGFAVRWPEIPAILMVFLLAELAVHLVVTAKNIGKEVDKATEEASRAVEKAKDVYGETNKAIDGINAAQEELSTIQNQAQTVFDSLKETSEQLNQAAVNLTGLPFIKLWQGSGPKFYNTVDLSHNQFWKDLDQFTRDWTPRSGANGEKRHELVGVLFDNFIGNDQTGSVQSTKDAVSCVTLDSVYAEASVKWLEKISEEAEKGKEKVVVWAVSSLLPTEFALPAIWWDMSDQADRWNTSDQADRTKALKQFVGAVVDQITKKSPLVGEYRRITVFRKDDPRMDLWLEELKNTLEHWFLWDTRLPDNKLTNSSNIRHYSITVIRKIWEHLKRSDPVKEVGESISWENIKDEFVDLPERFKEYPQITRRHRILPKILDSPKAFYLYENSPNELEDLGVQSVIGANEKALEMKVSLETIDAIRLEKIYVDRLRATFPTQIDFSIRDILSIFGWSSIKEWYCRYMQYCPSKFEDGGWWSILEKDYTFLDSLKIKWGDYEILPLDLLLIGTRPEAGQVNWHGAAISNISFEHTECSVRLVTNRSELQKIEEAVRILASNFTTSPANKEYVNNHARWMEFMPSVIDTEKESDNSD